MSSSSSGFSTSSVASPLASAAWSARTNAGRLPAAASSPTVISVTRGRWFCG